MKISSMGAEFFQVDGRRETDRQTDSQTDRQTDRETDRQTDRQDEANSRFLQFCERSEKSQKFERLILKILILARISFKVSARTSP